MGPPDIGNGLMIRPSAYRRLRILGDSQTECHISLGERPSDPI
jgi:hypothetical protein